MQTWQRKLKALTNWWKQPCGNTLLHLEKIFLSDYLDEQFGFQMVIIADNNYAELNQISRMQNVTRLDPHIDNIIDLPSNVDCIVVPHMFAYNDDIESWLKAFWQALTPNGQLILTGYSYRSFLGLQKLLRSTAVRGLPERENNRKIVRASLAQHDFTLLLDHKFAPRWLFSRNNLDSRTHVPSIFGDIYCFVASKQLVPIESKKPKWDTTPALGKQSLASSFIEKKNKHES
jgi:SAM-dependent methyltransferase